MLTIRMEQPPRGYEANKQHFDMVYKDEWFDDPLVKQIIKDIDGSDVISSLSMNNPTFGIHTYRELSSGAVILILLLKEETNDFPLYLTKCGDNCTPWICRISKMVDKEVYLRHLMRFEDNADVSGIRIAKCDKAFRTGKELNKGILDYYLENREEIDKPDDYWEF